MNSLGVKISISFTSKYDDCRLTKNRIKNYAISKTKRYADILWYLGLLKFRYKYGKIDRNLVHIVILSKKLKVSVKAIMQKIQKPLNLFEAYFGLRIFGSIVNCIKICGTINSKNLNKRK